MLLGWTGASAISGGKRLFLSIPSQVPHYVDSEAIILINYNCNKLILNWKVEKMFYRVSSGRKILLCCLHLSYITRKK